MMDNVAISSRQNVDVLLGAVGEQLEARGEHHSIVVVGGAALMALGLVSRGTRDVDELRTAARWSETQDASVGYREVLLRVLDYLGVSGEHPRA